MYNMVYHLSKAIHVENDILNLSPIRQNRNAFPREGNSCGYDSSMIIIYDEKLCDTIIYGNRDLSGNKIMEIIYSVLSSFHICGAKYRIYSNKKETATTFTINKMPEDI